MGINFCMLILLTKNSAGFQVLILNIVQFSLDCQLKNKKLYKVYIYIQRK